MHRDDESAAAAPWGGGVFELGDAIALGGEISRPVGGRLELEWRAGAARLCPPDVVVAAAGGAPTPLPEQILSTLDLGLGVHRVDLVLGAPGRARVAGAVQIEVTQPGRPTLAPVARPAILWPPDGRAADVWLEVRGADRHGRPPALDVDLGEAVSWGGELLDVDTARGLVHLRLRAAGAVARSYRIGVTAVDDAGRSSSNHAGVVAPAPPSSVRGPSRRA